MLNMGYSDRCLYICLATFLYFASNIFTDAAPIKSKKLLKDQNYQSTSGKGLKPDIELVKSYISRTEPEEMTNGDIKIRAKRQSGAGKYTDAAKMPQVKLMRLNLQMFKNLIDPSHVGGSHPFHHSVPKPVIELFVMKFMTFFFPPVGVPDKTQ